MTPNTLYLVQNFDLIGVFTIVMTGVLLLLYCARIMQQENSRTYKRVNDHYSLSETNSQTASVSLLPNEQNQQVSFMENGMLFYMLTYRPTASPYSSFYMWNDQAAKHDGVNDYYINTDELEQV